MRRTARPICVFASPRMRPPRRPGDAGRRGTPDDTPSIKIGRVFGDYTYTQSPRRPTHPQRISPASSRRPQLPQRHGQHRISSRSASAPSSFVRRHGTLASAAACRVTASSSASTPSASSTSTLDDQGIVGPVRHPATPWVDFEENIYRYRFQGTVFAEREGASVVAGRLRRFTTTSVNPGTCTSGSTTARPQQGRSERPGSCSSAHGAPVRPGAMRARPPAHLFTTATAT